MGQGCQRATGTSWFNLQVTRLQRRRATAGWREASGCQGSTGTSSPHFPPKISDAGSPSEGRRAMVFGSGSQNRGASLAVHMLSCHSPRQGGGVSFTLLSSVRGSLTASFHPNCPRSYVHRIRKAGFWQEGPSLPSIPEHPMGVSTASHSPPGQDHSLCWAGVSVATAETRLGGTLLVGSTSNGHSWGEQPSWGRRGERATTDSQTTQSPEQNSPSNKAWSKQIIFVVRKSVSTYGYNYHLWFCHSGKVAAAALIRVRLNPASC